jgi:CRISPR-associated endonuclease/helicase Cas3
MAGDIDAGRAAEWVEAAPEAWRALWGKAKPAGQAQVAHPLFAHMLDVAVVAERLVAEFVPGAAWARLQASTGLEPQALQALLPWFVALHDLGKASPAFQAKVGPLAAALQSRGFHLAEVRPNDLNHGDLGSPLLSPKLMARGLPKRSAHRVAAAVCAHHGRFDYRARDLTSRETGSPAWEAARDQLDGALARLLLTPAATEALRSFSLRSNATFDAFLAGLTAVADWIGSMAEVFEYVRPDVDLDAYLVLARQRATQALTRIGMTPLRATARRSFGELFPFEPRPLQRAAIEIADAASGPVLVLVEAPMGEGKTEAALYLSHALTATAGQGGLYFALPTQATANQMLERVRRFLSTSEPKEQRHLQLAHGEKSIVARYGELLSAVYDEGANERMGGVRAAGWFSRAKHVLLAPFGTGTVDQALLGTLQVKHAFVRLFGLAGKTVVFDEVHAYDTYTSELIDRLIAWLHALGSSVVILSATLPSGRRAQILEAFGATEPADAAPYPRCTVVDAGCVSAQTLHLGREPVTVGLIRREPAAGALARALADELRDGGCVGWILNTVKAAQQAFVEVQALIADGTLPPDTEVLLLHARLLVGDRQRREVRLEQALGPRSTARPTRMIVIGTQVLEQSLDVDFDLMLTELAPVDLVLQRAGRLHRHAGRVRPERHRSPRIWLLKAPGDPLRLDLGVSRFVYEPLILRRTAWALEQRRQLELPSDIEPLVEIVYARESPPELAEALAAEQQTHDERLAKDRQEAITALVGAPDETDAFAPRAALEDPEDGESEYSKLFAKTRLGDPSITLVCLHRRGGQLFLEPDADDPIDVHRPPEHEELRALLGASVRSQRKGLVPALSKLQNPSAWSEVALLQHRRLVVFDEGRAQVDDYVLFLHPELGLVYDELPEAQG